MNLTNEQTFDHFVVLCFFLALIYYFVTLYILYKKGVDCSSLRVTIGIALTAFPIGFLPYWLRANISWQFKIFGPIVLAIIAIIYGLGIQKVGKTIGAVIREEKKGKKGKNPEK